MVIDVLARFTNDAIVQERTEVQAFFMLPSFLSELALSKFESGVEMVGTQEDGVYQLAKGGSMPASHLRHWTRDIIVHLRPG